MLLGLLLLKKNSDAILKTERLRAVVDHQDGMSFLLDREFEVKESNCISRVPLSEKEPLILGNVLHCKNAHASGECGTDSACVSCPVRFVLNKSFDRKDDFRALEVTMELYANDRRVVDVDVSIDGHYVIVNGKPHMVVNVKDLSSNETLHQPKVLFASANVELYDKVRMALGSDFRVLNADNEHTALHRLLMVSSYNFAAIISDSGFLGYNDEIAKILARSEDVSIFIFGEGESEKNMLYLSPDIESSEIRRIVLEQVKYLK